MNIKIRWTGAASFAADSESGHTVQMDGPPEAGGSNQGPRPMEMILMGLGGCAAFDVVSILHKGRQEIVDCVATIEAERAPDIPKVFTRIHVHFTVTGHNLVADKVSRAISLSAEKYCSASIMLAKTAEMSHDFEIIEAS